MRLRTESREEAELWTEWCGEWTGVAGSMARVRGEFVNNAISAFAGGLRSASPRYSLISLYVDSKLCRLLDTIRRHL